MAEQLHRVEVPAPLARHDEVAAVLWALGARGVWERDDRLLAWVADPSLASDARLARVAAGPVTCEPEAEHDWQASWKATISPVRAGRTVVVPSWLAAHHRPGPQELTLVLDPGQAFGTGHHATTALCLEVLDELDIAEGLRGRSVLDVGCGSGILAIAAAARGAEVVALDLDEDAVAVTRDNAAANEVDLCAEVGAVEDLRDSAEIVVANLISDVVRDHATTLVAATSSTLIVSGIAEERAEEVLAALVAAGAEVREIRHRDGWIAARLAPHRPVADRAGEDGHHLAHPQRSRDARPRRDRGTDRGPARSVARGTLLVAGALLAAACTAPGVPVDAPSEQPPPEQPSTTSAPSPEDEELLADLAATQELLEQLDAELVAAGEASSANELGAAIARADALLVSDPSAGTRALFPSETLERDERAEEPAQLTELLARAREVGGSLGRSVVENLRDPIAGDLGAWERDAAGVVARARDATDGVTEESTALERVLALDGEGPRAIAWLSLAGRTEAEDLARRAVELTRDHVEVMVIALQLAAGPARDDSPGEEDPTDELGPPDPDAAGAGPAGDRVQA
ncbi:MAG: 50S ribosomal protein L11 methyltransferase [Nitriliruptoraceae bacterium]